MVLEMEDEESVDEEIKIIEEGGVSTVNSNQGDRPRLSMNALSIASTYQTIPVSGIYNKKKCRKYWLIVVVHIISLIWI